MKRSENKQQVTLTDWAIVFYPSIYDAIEHPETVFAKHHCGRPIALFGMAKDDPRHNGETGAFADGHRLITSPIIEIVNGKYHTFNTIYVLDEDNINKDYKKWCEEHQYEQVPNENPNNIIIRHICETAVGNKYSVLKKVTSKAGTIHQNGHVQNYITPNLWFMQY